MIGDWYRNRFSQDAGGDVQALRTEDIIAGDNALLQRGAASQLAIYSDRRSHLVGDSYPVCSEP